MEVLQRASLHLQRTAVVTARNTSFQELFASALKLVPSVRQLRQPGSAHGPRIGVFVQPGPEYVAATWAAWAGGGIAVPLCRSHPVAELQYVVEDAGVSSIVCGADDVDVAAAAAKSSNAKLVVADEVFDWNAAHAAALDEQSVRSELHDVMRCADDGCLIIYTSGTTGRPKGVLHTHGSVAAQVAALCDAWRWSEDDVILHALPLHHVHGIVNALACAHAAGACVEFQLPRFSASRTWQRFNEGGITVYMAVPTMYHALIAAYDKMSDEEQSAARRSAHDLRLTVSGSAACPVPLMLRWNELSGQYLLERYGMTEIGMALSNPYEGERRPGCVGTPLPGVEVRIASVNGNGNGNGNGGELLVRGPLVFKEYWNKPQATADAFDDDGFFKTGDTVALDDEQPPYYKILGRTSVDIIKSRGYKISALHIENKVLEWDVVRECAVIGLPHEAMGESIAAVIALNDNAPSQMRDADCLHRELKKFLLDKLPKYQIPQQVMVVDAMPRNVMGKINKKTMIAQYSNASDAAAAAT